MILLSRTLCLSCFCTLLTAVFLLCFICTDKDKADKTFSFAFLKIMNPDGSIIRDGQHELCVYKAEPRKWKNASQYLSLPSKKAESHQVGHQTMSASNMTTASGQIQRNFKETIWMSTICCSTKLTQRSEWSSSCDVLILTIALIQCTYTYIHTPL